MTWTRAYCSLCAWWKSILTNSTLLDQTLVSQDPQLGDRLFSSERCYSNGVNQKCLPSTVYLILSSLSPQGINVDFYVMLDSVELGWVRLISFWNGNWILNRCTKELRFSVSLQIYLLSQASISHILPSSGVKINPEPYNVFIY